MLAHEFIENLDEYFQENPGLWQEEPLMKLLRNIKFLKQIIIGFTKDVGREPVIGEIYFLTCGYYKSVFLEEPVR